ncbi:MAG: hypothetical protein NZM37_09440 [Sandaracinaceae bacterium]|nr:hypothetical protein [Sandaracinaceae bacterium]MDW8245616.1 hypothetical protein [Sandaracinaceae bacterium]
MMGSCLLAIVPSKGNAQGREALEQAERAFIDVDFETAMNKAQEALQKGWLSPAQLVRAYQILGVCATAFGQPTEARDHFTRMLVIDPQSTLDDTVPPRLRAPFYEAKGVVEGRAERLSAEVGLDRAQGGLRIAIVDPFQLVKKVRVHARLEGAVEFEVSEFAPSPELLAPVEGSAEADRTEYWLELLDEHSNQLLVLGSEFEPRVVGRLPGVEKGVDLASEPLFWIVIGAAALAGAVTTAVLVDQGSKIELQTSAVFGVN